MTREEDLIRIAKKLDKMVSRNNTEGSLDLLKELKNFNMTLKLLQETRIGMSVNGIRKHCTDEDVVALAKILIKDWKRLLDSAHSPDEKANEMMNGIESCSVGSAKPSLSEKETRHRTPDVELQPDFEPEKTHSGKHRMNKCSDEHKNEKRGCEVIERNLEGERGISQHNNHNKRPLVEDQHAEEHRNQTELPEKEKHMKDHKKGKHVHNLHDEKPKEKSKNERQLEESKIGGHTEDFIKERHVEDTRKQSNVREWRDKRPIPESQNKRTPYEPYRDRQKFEAPKERPVDIHRPMFERRGVLDNLYPGLCASPPRIARPPAPVKGPSVEGNKDRKDTSNRSSRPHHPKASTDTSSRPPHPSTPHPTPPPAKRASLETKKERKKAPDSKPLHAPRPLQFIPPPPPRKEPPDPNAPLPPLPFHLHPPPAPVKRPLVEAKKERKESSDSMLCFVKSTDHKKKERKHSTDGKTSEDKVVEGKTSDDKVSHGTVLERKVTKNLLVEVKKERKESTDSKPPLKRSSLDGKKNKDRKDSSDSKPAHPTKRPSSDSKSDRRESTDSKTSSSPLAKKLTGERRESQGSKSTHTGTPQRKSSTDSIERRGKADTPKSPTTPTSPMSPSFSSAGGPLSPRLATGDSIRDKCIEMLTAALRTDDNYKEFGTNCDSMAAELEDFIYQEFKATDMKYKNKVRSRISNLKDPKNPGLRRNILAGGLELSRFANMTSEEMASDELKQLRNDLTQEAIREHQMAKTSGTTTDMLQCSKCRKKNCSYNQVQTRSADEPMTTFVLCNECGNRWKFC